MKTQIKQVKKSRRIRVFLMLLVLTVSTFCGVNWYMTRLEAKIADTVDTVSVIVAARNLESGHLLEKEDLTVKKFLRESVITGSYLGEGQENLVGKTLKFPVQAGEQLTQSKLAPELDTTNIGKRWYVIEGSQLEENSLLKPGDRVDIIAILANHEGTQRASCIMQNVLVAKVVRPNDDAYTLESASPSIIVETSLKDAQRLALAEEMGYLKLVKRSKDDLSVARVSKIDESDIDSTTTPLKPKVQYRRIEIIHGAASESIYLPASSWR